MSKHKQKQQKREKRREQRRKRPAKDRPGFGNAIANVQGHGNPLGEEVEYIIERAGEWAEASVRLGGFVLFSTATGDAWLLEVADQLALCLAQGGDRLPFTILDHGAGYRIGYSARFVIDGDKFVVVENSGRVRTILGYPMEAIRSCCRSAREGRATPRNSSAKTLATTSPRSSLRGGSIASSSAGTVDWDLALKASLRSFRCRRVRSNPLT